VNLTRQKGVGGTGNGAAPHSNSCGSSANTVSVPEAHKFTTAPRQVVKGGMQSVHDAVWGDITLPAFVWVIVDTPHFQRLRYLRQNGLLHLVFPGAVHTRFAHSLGTAWLAYRLMRRLQTTQTHVDITDGEVNTVVVAALCHDLGHGPCSHAFDLFMAHVDPCWSHECQSIELLRHMLQVTPDADAALRHAGVDVHAACEMVLGSKEKAPRRWRWHGPPPGREFLYEVVSCSPTGIDVDKWDYIRRDSYFLNIPNGFVCKRLLKTCRVQGGRLAWPSSETATIMDMFQTRFQLHDRAYQHCKSRLVDCMVMRALLLMKDSVIGHSSASASTSTSTTATATVSTSVEYDAIAPEAVEASPTAVTIATAYRHPEVYLRLTDTLVDCRLQGLELNTGVSVKPSETEEEARQLYARVHTRQLWHVVVEQQLSKTCLKTPREFTTELCRLVSGITERDICVDVACINCGKGRRNPMKNVRLYSVGNDYVCSEVDTEDADYVRPTTFQKRVLRVFVCDIKHVDRIRAAIPDRWAWRTVVCLQ
jgi:HD superfamily phosphohydrolase